MVFLFFEFDFVSEAGGVIEAQIEIGGGDCDVEGGVLTPDVPLPPRFGDEVQSFLIWCFIEPVMAFDAFDVADPFSRRWTFILREALGKTPLSLAGNDFDEEEAFRRYGFETDAILEPC